MNIYFSDDELRKQAESMVSRLVVTGQEAVEGNKQGMRQDLYKKHLSADPIACRLPYAVVTKLVELIGWKRFELNNLMRFVGVDETSFVSIFRRSLVVEYKGRFTTAAKIERIGGAAKAAKVGIFEMKNDLKDFLKGKCAAQLLFKLVHGAMMDTPKDAMHAFIEEYVESLDEGLTRQKIREACGLRDKKAGEATPSMDAEDVQSPSTPAAAAAREMLSPISPATPAVAGDAVSPQLPPVDLKRSLSLDSQELFGDPDFTPEISLLISEIRGDNDASQLTGDFQGPSKISSGVSQPSTPLAEVSMHEMQKHVYPVAVRLLEKAAGDYVNIEQTQHFADAAQYDNWNWPVFVNSRSKRTDYFKRLADNGLFIKVDKRRIGTKSTTSTVIPRIKTKNNFNSICPSPLNLETVTKYPECWDIGSFRNYMNSNAEARKHNITVFSEYYTKAVKTLGEAGRGSHQRK